MTDLSTTIAPKSDQLNADDLIAGPREITITRVRGCSEPDQPVAVHFEGDDGKPYKPCKSMRRVLVFAWGPNGQDYVGRRLRLYRDEKVMFGGIQVGGIRISHMSHIERDMTMALTATRAKRSPYTVRPLHGGSHARVDARRGRDDAPRAVREPDDFPGDAPPHADAGGFGAMPDELDVETWARELIDEPERFTCAADIDAFFRDEEANRRFGKLNRESPTIARQLEAALKSRRKALADRERSAG